LKNKPNEDNYPPLMRFEISKYYQSKESDVMDYVKAILSNSSITNSMQFLKKLIR